MPALAWTQHECLSSITIAVPAALQGTSAVQVLDQLDSIAPVHAMATGLACSAQATAEEPTRGPEQVVAAVGELATSIVHKLSIPVSSVCLCSTGCWS